MLRTVFVECYWSTIYLFLLGWFTDDDIITNVIGKMLQPEESWNNRVCKLRKLSKQ